MNSQQSQYDEGALSDELEQESWKPRAVWGLPAERASWLLPRKRLSVFSCVRQVALYFALAAGFAALSPAYFVRHELTFGEAFRFMLLASRHPISAPLILFSLLLMLWSLVASHRWIGIGLGALGAVLYLGMGWILLARYTA